MRRVAVVLSVGGAVLLPLLTFSASMEEGGTPGRSQLAPGRQQGSAPTSTPTVSQGASPAATPAATPQGKLRRPEHAERLVRVQGFANGMTNKLMNLSERLGRHRENFERRIAALEAAGHDITVDTELAAARAVVADAQAEIAKLTAALTALPDSETPRQDVRKIRQDMRSLRLQLRRVRADFQTLRLAISADVRASRSSPSPTPSLTVSPTPFDSTPLPTLSPVTPTPTS